MLIDSRYQSHPLQRATVREFPPPWEKSRSASGSLAFCLVIFERYKWVQCLVFDKQTLSYHALYSGKSEIYWRWWITVNLSSRVFSRLTPFSHVLKINDGSPTSVWGFILCQRVYSIKFSWAVSIINCMQSNNHSTTCSANRASSNNSNVFIMCFPK